MFVLTATDHEWIQVGPDVFVQAYRHGNRIKVAIDAPTRVQISRVANPRKRVNRDEKAATATGVHRSNHGV